MDKKFDKLVFIGRFQPFHNSHLETLKKALELSEMVFVIIGSADQPRTFKNPWNVKERSEMVKQSIPEEDRDRVVVFKNHDTLYNDPAWVGRVQKIVDDNSEKRDKVGLIGYKKDDSSFYLDFFPQWEFVNFSAKNINATNIREIYFQPLRDMEYLEGVVPQNVLDFLTDWRHNEYYEIIKNEYTYSVNYKQQFAILPYKPTFNTADALVVCNGHILMIERKELPGRGLYALPGGFLNADSDKSLEDAAIRELKEETGIKVPVPVLKGSIKSSRVFDGKDRSIRGRVITQVFLIELGNEKELPKVRGGDDAHRAFWLPISKVIPSRCFEDHYEIIQCMTGI